MVWKNMLAFPSPKNMTVILCAFNLGWCQQYFLHMNYCWVPKPQTSLQSRGCCQLFAIVSLPSDFLKYLSKNSSWFLFLPFVFTYDSSWLKWSYSWSLWVCNLLSLQRHSVLSSAHPRRIKEDDWKCVACLKASWRSIPAGHCCRLSAVRRCAGKQALGCCQRPPAWIQSGHDFNSSLTFRNVLESNEVWPARTDLLRDGHGGGGVWVLRSKAWELMALSH